MFSRVCCLIGLISLVGELLFLKRAAFHVSKQGRQQSVFQPIAARLFDSIQWPFNLKPACYSRLNALPVTTPSALPSRVLSGYCPDQVLWEICVGGPQQMVRWRAQLADVAARQTIVVVGWIVFFSCQQCNKQKPEFFNRQALSTAPSEAALDMV